MSGRLYADYMLMTRGCVLQAEMSCIFEMSTVDGRSGLADWGGLTIQRGLYVLEIVPSS